jgi:type I restriction enzyme R subunit
MFWGNGLISECPGDFIGISDISQNLADAGYSNVDIATLTAKTEFYSDTRAAIKRHSGEELDIKPFEADMRHLINTYIQADRAEDLGDLNSLFLTELIIDTRYS